MYSLPKNVYRERIDFSKIKTTIPIPNLIEIQKKSYERFLQMNRLPAEREDVGLQSVFKSVFPISDFRENSSLEFIEYSIGNWECKCGRLAGLEHLRKKCDELRHGARRRPVRRRRRDLPDAADAPTRRAGDVCDLCGTTVADEAEVRRRGVPGARHDVRRAAQGDDPARRLEQGPGDGRQDDPRHQGAGGLLRRHPAHGRPRHLHHQRHRAGHRQPAPPVAGRLLPHRGQDALRRADHPVPRVVGGVRVRREEPAVRPDRPQAQVPRDGVPAGARPARRQRDPEDVLHGRRARAAGRQDPLEGVRLRSSGGGRPQELRDSGVGAGAARRQEDPPRPGRGAEEGRRRGGRARRHGARGRVFGGRHRRPVDGRGHPRGQRGALRARHRDGAGEGRRAASRCSSRRRTRSARCSRRR